MKNRFTIYLIFIGLFAFACSSEKNDKNNTAPDSLAGLGMVDSVSKNQEVLEPMRFFVYADTIDWRKFDTQVTDTYRKQITEKLKVHFDSLAYYYDNESYKEKKFKDCFHFMDLNADGKLDVIYGGFSGSEASLVKIFLQKENQFVPVFEGYQELSASFFDANKKLTSFILLDFGCCADYIEYETKYNVLDDFNIALNYQRARIVRTQAPKTIWNTPIKFITLNDGYALRSEPMKEDTATYIYDAIGEGNTVAKYPKNAKGLAWAEYKDKSNRVWWFVEMYPAENLKKNLIYKRDSLVTPRALGWMSSRFLQKQP